MSNNAQGRKWLLTINNPLDAGFDHATIKDLLDKSFPVYYCLADEVAQTGTYHTHVFMMSESPIRFSTIKNRFLTAHIDKAYGTAAENRAYIRKEGKWANTEKSETTVPDTFEEYGWLPTEQQEKAPQMYRLLDDIRNGLALTEIIDKYPNFGFKIREIEKIRQTFLSDKYSAENRPLEVTYIYGPSGSGKTRFIYERYNYRDICRISNYRTGKGILFDDYIGQDILVFDDFKFQPELEEIKNYIDVYPTYLPARYSNKVACFTKVYIISNLPLEKQYTTEQWAKPDVWDAFVRRINNIIEFMPDGTAIIHKGGLAI